MEERPKTTTNTETIYFPISFLRSFEAEPQKTARKILSYVFNVLQKKTSKTEAARRIGFTDFEQYGKVEKYQPQTFFNIDYVKKIAGGCGLSSFETSLFLYVCAARSLMLKEKACRTDWNMIAARMSGYSYFNTENNLTPSASHILKRAERYRENLKKSAFNLYGVGFYSSLGLRGFYVWRNMSFPEFISFYKEKINNEKRKTILQAKSEKIMYSVSDESIKLCVKALTNDNINEKELDIIRQRWNGKDIKSLENILFNTFGKSKIYQ